MRAPCSPLFCLPCEALRIEGGVKVCKLVDTCVGQLLLKILVKNDPRGPFVALASPCDLRQIAQEAPHWPARLANGWCHRYEGKGNGPNGGREIRWVWKNTQ